MCAYVDDQSTELVLLKGDDIMVAGLLSQLQDSTPRSQTQPGHIRLLHSIVVQRGVEVIQTLHPFHGVQVVRKHVLGKDTLHQQPVIDAVLVIDVEQFVLDPGDLFGDSLSSLMASFRTLHFRDNTATEVYFELRVQSPWLQTF